eukprot:XP_011613565.1 PREDICTED: peripheral-type benzodiazepine receptor-associated protein 1 [Takifugu rubripes]
MGCRKTCKVDKLLRQSQRDMVCGQRHRLPTAKKSNQIRGRDKINEVLPIHISAVQCLDSFHILEDRNQILKLGPETLSHQRLQQKLLETEISTRRKECEALEAEVKRKNQTCQTLENELQDFLEEKNHLNLKLFSSSSHKASEYAKSEYVNLKETLGAVTKERDLALLERNQLQGKLENLEQVLKVRNTVLIVCQYGSAMLPSSVLCGGLTKSCEGVDARRSLHPPHLSLPFSSSFTV